MPDAKSPPDLSMDEILARIRRILAEDEDAGARSPGAAADSAAVPGRPANGRHDDVLELTQALNDDGTVRHLAPLGRSVPQPDQFEPAPASAAPAATEAAAPQLEAAPAPAVEGPRLEVPEPRPEPEAPRAAEDRLIAEVASFAAAAIDRSAQRREPHFDSARSPGARTLEEVVCDLLRPMLQTWLDDNLPALVDKLVRAELARVVGKSGTA